MDIINIIKDWQPSWTIVILWIYFDHRYRKIANVMVNHTHDEEGKPTHMGNPDLLKDEKLI